MNKIRFTSIAIILGAAIIFISGHFGVRAEIKACGSPNNTVAQVVTYCTTVLERDDLSDEMRVLILFRRAFVSEPHDEYATAEADYLEVLKIRPDWTWPLNNLGLIYMSQDAPSKALPFFDRALAVEPDANHRRRNRADAYFALKRYTEALADTDIILKSEPDNLWVLHVRAQSLEKLGDYDQALEAYSRLVLLDSDPALNAHTRRNRAWLYYKHLKLPYHAEIDLRHVLARNPNDRIALVILGDVKLHLHRYAEAADAFERALVVKSDYSYARRGLDRTQSKIVEQRRQNKILSSPEAREIAGQSFGVLLAGSYAKLGETARALAEFDAVLTQIPDKEFAHARPENAFAHAGKARVYFELGNDVAAIAATADLLAAVAASKEVPNYWVGIIPQAHTRLGNSYHRLGDAELALSAWQKGLAGNHPNEVSLWQLRLQSAGHYSGWPNGEISNTLMDGLATCASDPDCLN